MKKILIICYSFPPFPGIGGRRWAKFAKYLHLAGHDVRIIAAENPLEEESQWTKDITKLNITYLPVRYPVALIKNAHPGILDKIKYRLGLLLVRASGKGNYYDRSLFWEKQLIKKASELISKHSIKNVIVSGPPFHLTCYAVKLKKSFPHICLITDFRDLWTSDHSISGLSQMPEKRKRYERDMEKAVLRQSDVVLTVSDKMTDYFRSLTPGIRSGTLINGYDNEDFESIDKEIPPGKNTEILNLVFTGTLYRNLEDLFILLVNTLKKFKKESPDLYRLFSFNFYGNAPKEIKEIVKNAEIDRITFYGAIPLREVYARINAADLCMLFLTDTYTFSLSTKFYEYISQRKKIALFSKKGETSEYIEKNGIGYWIDPEKTEEGLMKIIKDYKNGKINNWTGTIDIEKYSVRNLAKELEGYLQ